MENLYFIEEASSVESSSTNWKSESPISRDSDENKSLKQFCELYPNKLTIAHINRSSIRNKLDLLSDQIKGSVDILMISETFRYVNSKLMDLIHLFKLIGNKKVVA